MIKKQLLNYNLILKTIAVFFGIFTITISCKSQKAADPAENPWDLMYKIANSIVEPKFPNKTYNILSYGAVADGVTDNTVAINTAIANCSAKGGGMVLVPKGKYVTGAINLKSHVNLHVTEGAELLFSTDPASYPIVHTSFEGTELMNYSPLIYAYKQKNIAITGKGILNGQASNDNWWTWKGSKEYGWNEGMPHQNSDDNRGALVRMAEDNVPVAQRIFGDGRYLRPNFIEPYDCHNVLIKDVTIINAPSWVVHPLKCTNVTVDGIYINSHGPNNDGCNPEYSKNVIIKNSTFNTGDDCIAIKSGRDGDGRRVGMKSENIIIQNCKMVDGHGGVVLGSEITGGVRNVFVENCEMDSPHLDRAIRLKTNSSRGGLTENLYVRNIKVGEVGEAFLKIEMTYNVYGDKLGNYIPSVRNIYIENVTVANGGKFGILALGHPESPIQNVTLKNVVIDKVKKEYSLKHIENLQFINTTINGKLMKNSIN